MKLLISLSKGEAPHHVHVDPAVKIAQEKVDVLRKKLKDEHARLKGRWKINISGKQMSQARILEYETRLEEARQNLAKAKAAARTKSK